MKKGVALLWVLVLSVVLLIITGTMVSYIIKESRFSINIEDSTKAYSAAKTGIEWGRNELDIPNGSTGADIEIEPGQVMANVTIDRVSNKIVSRGQSGQVRRQLEYQVSQNPGTTIYPVNMDAMPLGPYDDSVEMQFDFWGTGTGNSSDGSRVGLDDKAVIGTDQNSISMVLTSAGNVNLKIISGKLGALPPFAALNSQGTPLVLPVGGPYDYQASIKYVKDTSVSLIIRKRVKVGDIVTFECMGSVIVDASTYGFGPFTSFDAEGGVNRTYITDNTVYENGDSHYGVIDAFRFDNINVKTPSGAFTPNQPTSYTLVTNVVGHGTVTANPSKSTYAPGEPVTLTATPSAGADFSSWSGDCGGSNNPLQITITGGNPTITCTAVFYDYVPVYRAFSSKEHFWTTSLLEIPTPAWTREGVGFYTPAPQIPGASPVYRLISTISTNRGFHFFTTSWDERQALLNSGNWSSEDVGFYAFLTQKPGTQPVHRFYKYTSKGISLGHMYTTSEIEKTNLINAGWNYDGAVFYVY